jgi:hypothetical protein
LNRIVFDSLSLLDHYRKNFIDKKLVAEEERKLNELITAYLNRTLSTSKYGKAEV